MPTKVYKLDDKEMQFDLDFRKGSKSAIIYFKNIKDRRTIVYYNVHVYMFCCIP